ncbi:MAG: PocR ligand-binding domain-containing protein [Spirochaetales bacterium]|nr:PocR ligand-binding domain-containing protein [Spirochaetales bacterium]
MLDIEKSLKAAADFSLVTGVECIVTNENGETIGEKGIVPSSCSLCSALKACTGKEINCRQSHLYGSENALRFGGKYTYFCPLSMTHFTSPILIDGVVRGALTGGPVLLIDREEFLQDEMSRHGALNDDDFNMLRRSLYDIPHISPRKVTALSELLLASASMLSDIKVSSYAEEMMFNSQQSRISEYIHHLKSMGGSEERTYSIDKEKELLKLITLGDKKGAQELLNEILGELFFSSGQNFEIIKSRILELVVLLSRAAMDGGANVEQIFGLNFNYLKEINQFRSIEPLCNWLTKIMVRFVDFVFDLDKVKHADAIYKSIQYLQEHYADKVTLEEVASAIYLSPAYFSKIFKEEMKITFKNYLNTLRIERSKVLMENRDIQLIDIAGLVGYEDQSYFSKVFKKITGLSPGKYRERRGRIPGEDVEIHQENSLNQDNPGTRKRRIRSYSVKKDKKP